MNTVIQLGKVWKKKKRSSFDLIIFLFCFVERWANGIAPGQSFDATTPSPLFVQYVQDGLIPNGRALVPGCGRGYDVTLLASEHRVAIGLEISPTAVTAAEDRLKNLPDEEFPHKSNALFQLANFFDLPAENEAEKFDFIYDYTFFCALNPKIRIDWANQMSRLVKKGGLLLTLIFPINAAHHGKLFLLVLSFSLRSKAVDHRWTTICCDYGHLQRAVGISWL
jgi:SAM-dependent methyltransferase